MVKSECFNKAGFFDENPILKGFDDFDVWLRILRHYEARYIHAPLALYRIRENNFSKNTRHMQRAHEYALAKAEREFSLSEDLVSRAREAMRKEWGLGVYAIPHWAREIKRMVTA
jgi:hypothetical protein